MMMILVSNSNKYLYSKTRADKHLIDITSYCWAGSWESEDATAESFPLVERAPCSTGWALIHGWTWQGPGWWCQAGYLDSNTYISFRDQRDWIYSLETEIKIFFYWVSIMRPRLFSCSLNYETETEIFFQCLNFETKTKTAIGLKIETETFPFILPISSP